MKAIANNLWVQEDIMPLMGSQLRLRMTIVKLSSGKLWIHSPTKLSAELKAQIDQAGPVGFLVGASNGHNLWLKEWYEAYPESKLYVSKGIPRKLKLTNVTLLDESSAQIWNEDLDCAAMHGVPFFDETVFLHKPSHSLIVTDFIQNHSDPAPKGFAGLVNKCVFQPLGFKGICTAPPLKFNFMIKDKARFNDFIETIKGWKFERIIVTHGDIIETDVKQLLEDLCQRFTR